VPGRMRPAAPASSGVRDRRVRAREPGPFPAGAGPARRRRRDATHHRLAAPGGCAQRARGRRMRRVAIILGVALLLGGCDVSMTEQRKFKTYAPASLWSDGTSARPLPPHAVAQGDVARAEAETRPPPVDDALLARGRARFDTFCAP